METMTRGQFKTMADVRAANKALGHHFFDRDAMAFFRSRIESELYGGRYFVTSEQYEDSKGNREARRYTVRMVQDSGDVDTAGEFQAYPSLGIAREVAKDLARQLV